ncbi:MAG: hypothetical protein AABW75_00455 [Nanoarchaeota archaeon]
MENPARKIKKICELTLATLFLCGCSSINQEDNKDQTKAGKFFSKFPEKIETSRFVFAQSPYFSSRASKSNLDGAQEPEHALEFSPRVLDMAGIVKKYETRSAKHCLVHMLQMHVTAFNRRKPYNSCMDEKTLEKINEVQNDIYDVLLQLKYDYGINEIYQEVLYEDEKI